MRWDKDGTGFRLRESWVEWEGTGDGGREGEREVKIEGKEKLREGCCGRHRWGWCWWNGKEREFMGKERESGRGKIGKGEAAGRAVVGSIEEVGGVGNGSCGRGCCGRHRGGWWSGEGKLREGLLWEA
jgi:hypothetical protein